MLRCRRRGTRKGSRAGLAVSLAAGHPEHHTNQQSKEDTAKGSRAGTQEAPSLLLGLGSTNNSKEGEEEKGAQGVPRLLSSTQRQGQASSSEGILIRKKPRKPPDKQEGQDRQVLGGLPVME